MNNQDRLSIIALLAVYVLSAVVSTPHLAEWYATYNGNLNPLLPWAIAISLELFVFVGSLISRLYAGREMAAYAFWGSTLALIVVVIGNWRSMWLTVEAPLWSLEWWLVMLASSVFALVGLITGKVIGGLLARADLAQTVPVSPVVPPLAQPQTALVQTVQVLVGQSVPSLDERTAELLKALGGETLGLSELARRSNIPKTTTLRLMERAMEQGLVERAEQGWSVAQGVVQ